MAAGLASRYLGRRHRRLMRESEAGLREAATDDQPRKARIAADLLNDPKLYRLWEAHHAEWLRPAAGERRRAPQIYALRRLETRLTHRSSLIDYIRNHAITGKTREKLFRSFYGPLDVRDAILIEHRQYLLSTGSQYSTDHLLDIMQDTASCSLMDVYRRAYSSYFSLYCYVNCQHDGIMASAAGAALKEARLRVDRLRRQLESQPPGHGPRDLEQAALLAESGRYPALNYLNR